MRTFVADHWTLEYDLAFCGLAEEVYVAACLAKNDTAINEEKKAVVDVEKTARTEFTKMAESAGEDRAKLCSGIYQLFHSGGASKAIAAQYLANALAKKAEKEGFDRTAFEKKLPRYIVDAIAHVRGNVDVLASQSGTAPSGDDADG